MSSTRRMCLMNLFLHNIGSIDGQPEVERADALLTPVVGENNVDYVLANPPFGKISVTTLKTVMNVKRLRGSNTSVMMS